MELSVKGRSKGLAATADPSIDGITIRVDDTNNLPFWAEIFISWKKLEELKIINLRDGEAANQEN